MKKYSLALSLLLCCFTSSVLATTLSEVDSLLSVYSNAKAEHKKLAAADLLHVVAADVVFFGDTVPVLDASVPSQRQDMIVYFAAERWLTTCSYFAEALSKTDIVTALAEELSELDVFSTALCDRAYCLYKLTRYTDAIESGQEAVRVASQAGNIMQLSRAYLYLSLVNYGLNNYEEALALVERSISTNAQLGVNIQTHNAFGVACELYCGARQVDKAIEYGKKAVEAARQIGYMPGVANHLTQLSYAYDRKGDYEIGLSSAQEAIEIVRAHEPLDRNQLAISLEFKAWNLIDLHRNQEAVEALLEAISLEKEIGNANAVRYDYRTLCEAYEPIDPKQAIAALRQYTLMSDSLHSVQLNELMSKANAELHNDELQKENEQKKSQIRLISWTIVALILLFSIIITSLWYAFRQKRNAEKALRMLSEAREAFFTNVTHEFRTPLTVILGVGGELQKHTLDAGKQHEAGDMIVRQGNRLLTLVNQMLDISKVKSAIGEQRRVRADVAAFVEMIVEAHRELARQKDITIVYNTDKGGIDVVFVADYVEKVVSNLLSNAVKFTPDGGEITVDLHSVGDNIMFAVKDTGHGIDQRDLPHIFEPFYRADNAEATGSGIGLALVRQIVEASGGTIEVESEKNKGTTFKIVVTRIDPLPDENMQDVKPSVVVNMPADDTTQPFESQIVSEAGKLSILIVEDNADVARYTGSLLADKYELHYAADGEQGLTMARELLPDIIITDLMMPHTDGLSLCRAIRQDKNTDHIPIIVVTAKATEADRIKGLKAGADTYLFKPFNSEELMVCITNLQEQRRRLEQHYLSLQNKVAFDAVDSLATDAADATSSVVSSMAFVRKLDEAIEHLLPDNCSAETLADEMCMSLRTLQRKTMSVTGMGPKKYIISARLKKARIMLEEQPERTLDDIAVACGFHDASHFIHSFQSAYGVSPRNYKG